MADSATENSPADTTNNVETSPPVTSRGTRSRRRAVRRIFLKLAGAALTAGIAAPVQARYIEPYALDVTQHEVFLPNLPPQHDGLLIAQLTDLHRGAHTPDRVIHEAISLTQAANPDLVVVTGDFVENNPADAIPVAEMLKRLSPRYGLWGCLGNHDYYGNANAVVENLQKHSSLRVLRNWGLEIAPGLSLAAIEDTYVGQPDIPATMSHVPADHALIFLTHNPKGVFAVTGRPSLVLAGHTHGGQVVIPGFPPPVPGGMDGFPLVAGWGTFDKAYLYISRGIGMSSIPLRFNCRPEVVLITLRRGTDRPKTSTDLTGRAVRKVARVARKLWHKLPLGHESKTG